MKGEYYDFGNGTDANGYDTAQPGRHIKITSRLFKQAVILLVDQHGRAKAQYLDLPGMRMAAQGEPGIGVGQYRAVP